ncbi:MAG TPA: toluene tolerance protein [Rhodospirillaceae bacterium]|nr:toluene tolerance protein [Rhodospirillaceae bacterium]
MQKTTFLRLTCWCLFLALAGATALSPTLGHAAGYAAPPAKPSVPPSAAGDVAAQPAEKFIQGLGDRAIKVIADKTQSPEERDQKYHQLLREAFDIAAIGRFVLGRSWQIATPEQQQEYLALFEKMVVKIYGNKLNFYSGESFRAAGSRQEGSQGVVVSSEVVYPDGKPPLKIDWRVMPKGGSFAIHDVVVEGVSQSITQRQEYASILQRNEGKIEALLVEMRAKVLKDSQ